MPTKNPELARLRLTRALERTLHGLNLQKRRLAGARAQAPEVVPGIAYLSGGGDSDNDADYYVYEMGRLHAVARAISGAFNKPPELEAARAAFDAAVPGLKKLRDPLTHPADNGALDNIIYVGGHVELDFGLSRRAQYPVDSRYEHHDAAVTLGNVLLAWLEDARPQNGATGGALAGS